MGYQNISQIDLSKKINKSYKSVNNWFSNRNITPKTEDALKIAQALNTTVEYLVTGQGPNTVTYPKRYADIIAGLDLLDNDSVEDVRALVNSKVARLEKEEKSV